jgi:hypothetical protein
VEQISPVAADEPGLLEVVELAVEAKAERVQVRE